MAGEASASSETGSQSPLYIGLGLALAVFGVWWSLWGKTRSVEYEVVEGISVFAVLYIIAQAAERGSELAVAFLSLLPGSPENRKNEELPKLRAANSTLNGNPTLLDFEAQKAVVSDKQESESKIKEARRDLSFFAGGFSLALCALAVNGLDYGLLDHVGAGNGLNPDHDRLITALAAAGGTKALHELIGRVQKAKESSEAGEK